MQSSVNFQLITNEISFRNNNIPNGEYSFSPNITRNITLLDKTHASVELILEIKNSDKMPFPIDVRVSLTGIFDIGSLPKESVDQFLKIQSVQILYPYIRTMVSNVTSSAFMPPVVLPLVDVATLFPEK